MHAGCPFTELHYWEFKNGETESRLNGQNCPVYALLTIRLTNHGNLFKKMKNAFFIIRCNIYIYNFFFRKL